MASGPIDTPLPPSFDLDGLAEGFKKRYAQCVLGYASFLPLRLTPYVFRTFPLCSLLSALCPKSLSSFFVKSEI
jgi:hypothetical protein